MNRLLFFFEFDFNASTVVGYGYRASWIWSRMALDFALRQSWSRRKNLVSVLTLAVHSSSVSLFDDVKRGMESPKPESILGKRLPARGSHHCGIFSYQRWPFSRIALIEIWRQLCFILSCPSRLSAFRQSHPGSRDCSGIVWRIAWSFGQPSVFSADLVTIGWAQLARGAPWLLDLVDLTLMEIELAWKGDWGECRVAGCAKHGIEQRIMVRMVSLWRELDWASRDTDSDMPYEIKTFSWASVQDCARCFLVIPFSDSKVSVISRIHSCFRFQNCHPPSDFQNIVLCLVSFQRKIIRVSMTSHFWILCSAGKFCALQPNFNYYLRKSISFLSFQIPSHLWANYSKLVIEY
jgi:hypothetical protein